MKLSMKFLIALVIFASGFAGWRVWKIKEEQKIEPKASSQIEHNELNLQSTDVLQTQMQILSQGLPVSGNLRAVNSAFVKARVSGELQNLTVREGDFVRAGQLLGRIEIHEYQTRLNQAKQQAEAAKAQLAIASRQFENNQALVKQGFISQTALETSQATLDSNKANYEAALSAVELMRKALDDTHLKAPISGFIAQRLVQSGERVATEARILEIVDLNQLELEAALNPSDANQLKIGQIALLDLGYSSNRLNTNNHIENNRKNNEVNQVHDHLNRHSNNNSNTNLNNNLNNKLNNSSDLSTQNNENAKIKATLVRINPSAQMGSRSVLAYLHLDQASSVSHQLKQGFFVQGRLQTTQIKAISVPLLSVRTDKPQPYIQVIENNRVQHRSVQLGARGEVNGEIWVALLDVPENVQVLQGNLGLIRAGTAVQMVSSL